MAPDLESAIALAAIGAFGQAHEMCDELAAVQQPAGHVLRASMWRQLGDAERARQWDQQGFDEAIDDETRVDACIGLAADAVAINDLPKAQRILHGITEPTQYQRVHIRWLWVQAELALAKNDVSRATQWAEQAVAVSTAYGSARHLTKSRLILAVARSDTDEAVACAHTAADAQWRYLAWAAATYLGSSGNLHWWNWASDLAEAIAERLNPQQLAVWRANPAVVAVRARVALGHV